MNILHITAHMGGGVGKVLSAVSSYSQQEKSPYRHKILLLEKPQKTNFTTICQENNVAIRVATSLTEITDEIANADIVQIEWWHHPLMAGLLPHLPHVPYRLMIWSHVSGCYYPYIQPAFLRMPLKFIFTSAYSYDNPFWDAETQKWATANCAMINSSGGFDNILPRIRPPKTTEFNVGYLGTQSFSKLHPRFLSFCQAAGKLPGIRFTLVGDSTNKSQLMTQGEKYGLADKLKFVDYVNDVNLEFQRMDVFGYLLNPEHFGTTENALLEAMAAELPVICLRQAAEKYLVKHNETGLLVDNSEEYGNAISYLYHHPEERLRLGRNGRNYVLNNLSVKDTVRRLNAIYDAIITMPKKTYDFASVLGSSPPEYFLAGLPPTLREKFTVIWKGTAPNKQDWPLILREKNKSSLAHFIRNYPQDETLQKWQREIITPL